MALKPKKERPMSYSNTRIIRRNSPRGVNYKGDFNDPERQRSLLRQQKKERYTQFRQDGGVLFNFLKIFIFALLISAVLTFLVGAEFKTFESLLDMISKVPAISVKPILEWTSAPLDWGNWGIFNDLRDGLIMLVSPLIDIIGILGFFGLSIINGLGYVLNIVTWFFV